MITHQKRSLRLILLIFLCGLVTPLAAQRIAVKTNALQWATLSPNVGMQLFMSERVSLEFSAAANPFTVGDYKLHYVLLEPEVRYWFNRPLAGHAAGFTLPYLDNSFRFKDTVYKGMCFGMGATYGYYWVLGRRWSMGATAGVGVTRYKQFKYDPATQQQPSKPNLTGWTVTPLQLALSFSYILR